MSAITTHRSKIHNLGSVNFITFLAISAFFVSISISYSNLNYHFEDPINVIMVSVPLYFLGLYIFRTEAISGNALSPLSIFSVAAVVHFALFSILQVSTLFPFLNSRNYDSLGYSVIFLNLCFLSYIFGYYVAKKITLSIPNYKKSVNNFHDHTIGLIRASLILLFIGWISRFYTISLGGYFKYSYQRSDIDISQQGLLGLLSGLPDLAAACFLFVFLSSSKKYFGIIFPASLIASNCLYWGGAGMKQEFLGSILLIFGVWYFVKRRLPRRGTMIASVIFLFAYLAINSGYRNAQENFSVADVRTFPEIIELASLMITRPIDEDNISSSSFTRFNLTETVSGAVQLVRQEPDRLRAGGDYADALGALVPRVLWSDKPSIGTIGNDFGHWIGMLNDPSDNITSISITWFGEAF